MSPAHPSVLAQVRAPRHGSRPAGLAPRTGISGLDCLALLALLLLVATFSGDGLPAQALLLGEDVVERAAKAPIRVADGLGVLVFGGLG